MTVTNPPEWDNEVPKSPGFYWMYGWVGEGGDRPANLYVVRAFRDSVGTLCFSIDGRHAYTRLLARKTLWMPVEAPPCSEQLINQLIHESVEWR